MWTLRRWGSFVMRNCFAGRLGATLGLAVLALGIYGLDQAKAQPADLGPPRHVKVVRFKSVTLRWPVPFATAVPGNVDIADILPEPNQELYIQGKKVGTTNISLFDQNRGLVEIIDLDVTLDVGEIRQRILFRHREPRHPRIRQQRPNHTERHGEEFRRRGPGRRDRQVVGDNGRRQGGGP